MGEEQFYNLVSGYIKEFDITEQWMAEKSPLTGPYRLYIHHAEKIRKKLKRMNLAKVTKIALQGKGKDDKRSGTTMSEVHEGSGFWLSGFWNPKDILSEMAVTAIVAKMWDILITRQQFPGELR